MLSLSGCENICEEQPRKINMIKHRNGSKKHVPKPKTKVKSNFHTHLNDAVKKTKGRGSIKLSLGSLAISNSSKIKNESIEANKNLTGFEKAKNSCSFNNRRASNASKRRKSIPKAP